MFKELHHPFVVDVVKEPLDICVQYPVHAFLQQRVTQCIECLMASTTRSKAIAEAEEVGFVDRLQYCSH